MANTNAKTAAQFWQDATPQIVRKLYKAAGLHFTEAVLFSAVEFALLPAALKVAIYESAEFHGACCEFHHTGGSPTLSCGGDNGEAFNRKCEQDNLDAAIRGDYGAE